MSRPNTKSVNVVVVKELSLDRILSAYIAYDACVTCVDMMHYSYNITLHMGMDLTIHGYGLAFDIMVYFVRWCDVVLYNKMRCDAMRCDCIRQIAQMDLYTSTIYIRVSLYNSNRTYPTQ